MFLKRTFVFLNAIVVLLWGYILTLFVPKTIVVVGDVLRVMKVSTGLFLNTIRVVFFFHNFLLATLFFSFAIISGRKFFFFYRVCALEFLLAKRFLDKIIWVVFLTLFFC